MGINSSAFAPDVADTTTRDKYSQVRLRQANGIGGDPHKIPPGSTIKKREDEDTRFLFVNKKIVGDSKDLEYLSTAVETLLTGAGLAKGGSKVLQKSGKGLKNS